MLTILERSLEDLLRWLRLVVVRNSGGQRILLALFVGVSSYLLAWAGGVLVLQPEMIWPLWPGCAFLVAVLVCTRRKISWPALLTAGLAGFVLYDLQAGLNPHTIALYILADAVEILIAAFGVTYAFEGPPHLSSIRSFAKYLTFAVILAPAVSALITANTLARDYWAGWRIGFLTESLALLTLTPAIVNWFDVVLSRSRKRVGYYIELAMTLITLAALSYAAFVSPEARSRPVLLYSLLPFLLWSALRLGITGITNSLIVIALFSVWGVVHGGGPFHGPVRIADVLYFQLFFLFAAFPFISLAALMEERKKTEQELRSREAELLQAQRVAQVGSWQWEQKTDIVTWSRELYRIAGRTPALPPPAFAEQSQLYTPESWHKLNAAVAEILRTGKPYELDLQMIRPDGSTRWVTDRGEALLDASGRIAWLRGTAQDTTERKQAEEALRASEEKFRSVFRDAGVGMVIISLDGRFLAANDAFCRCLGYTQDELLEMTVQSVTVTKDWPSFSQRLHETVEKGISFQNVEKGCLHKGGGVVLTESSASLIRDPNGEPLYIVGEVLDVTKRKLAEEALSSVSRRLIGAHEEERTHIARELHDDINQRMALLAGNLERIKDAVPASEIQTGRLIEEACERVSAMASDIQALSHRLHSSKLEFLGLAAACASFCRELSARHNMKIEFRSDNVPQVLAKEISVCLFRVLQEALQNAIKHSGAQEIQISLISASDEMQLIVHDSGVGFDAAAAMAGHGLGLVSMRERLKLVDGHLSIDSQLQGGTTIHARVPLAQTKSVAAG